MHKMDIFRKGDVFFCVVLNFDTYSRLTVGSLSAHRRQTYGRERVKTDMAYGKRETV